MIPKKTQGNNSIPCNCPFCNQISSFKIRGFPVWERMFYYGEDGCSAGIGKTFNLNSHICDNCWEKNKCFGLIQFENQKDILDELKAEHGSFIQPLICVFDNTLTMVVPFKERRS